jgi:hypothetical protein
MSETEISKLEANIENITILLNNIRNFISKSDFQELTNNFDKFKKRFNLQQNLQELLKDFISFRYELNFIELCKNNGAKNINILDQRGKNKKTTVDFLVNDIFYCEITIPNPIQKKK